jgi:hypothetical protein
MLILYFCVKEKCLQYLHRHLRDSICFWGILVKHFFATRSFCGRANYIMLSLLKSDNNPDGMKKA